MQDFGKSLERDLSEGLRLFADGVLAEWREGEIRPPMKAALFIGAVGVAAALSVGPAGRLQPLRQPPQCVRMSLAAPNPFEVCNTPENSLLPGAVANEANELGQQFAADARSMFFAHRRSPTI